uniref:Uncharacterized protein n=1 Tax=Myotis myotis TaxID=51298 RepID=A0A7J7ZXK1_MYOMY|nr:hypothetical protein mMyoMyo1_009690 [Myotis myotis]
MPRSKIPSTSPLLLHSTGLTLSLIPVVPTVAANGNQDTCLLSPPVRERRRLDTQERFFTAISNSLSSGPRGLHIATWKRETDTHQLGWNGCWRSVTMATVGIIGRDFQMVPGLIYFYAPQVLTNGAVLFIYGCTTNDPKLSGLKMQLFYDISQFMGPEFKQSSVERYFSFMWL